MLLLYLLKASAVLCHALPTSQVVLQSAEDAALLSSLAEYEGKEGFSLDLNAMRLVQLSVDESPAWMSEREKIILKSHEVSFLDVTEGHDLVYYAFNNLVQRHAYAAPNSTHVKPILALLSEDGPRENLAKFTSFETRYYLSDSGKKSSEWLLAKVKEYIDAAPKHIRAQYTAEAFEHSWEQSSIIARISPVSFVAQTAPLTIMSAHCDSYNMNPLLPAPGADDDGSGTVSVLEAFRALVEAEYIPATPVEFHWYAAEEGGLLGSQAIVESYAKAGIKIKAQQQFDMTAWVWPHLEEVVGILTDYVDPALSEFNRQLVDRYLSIPHKNTTCGICSDHVSWNRAGFPSSASFEDVFVNMKKGAGRQVHNVQDTTDWPEFSFSHVVEFSKLAVAFAVELGGWGREE